MKAFHILLLLSLILSILCGSYKDKLTCTVNKLSDDLCNKAIEKYKSNKSSAFLYIAANINTISEAVNQCKNS